MATPFRNFLLRRLMTRPAERWGSRHGVLRDWSPQHSSEMWRRGSPRVWWRKLLHMPSWINR